ncbi:MAG: hypothetical protein RMZ42_28895 [Nostoc sp. DedQUE05]|uniref:hypothetical protein n=1 Tax=Nostoc sp. DedQUE05 TaxID=3075391 RepID=UPI002AD59E09|nr:hypothetical protein [Nostoc sp. DedQUE05]MDZ8095924.1 hypothetical protein [Nostoc sp. DedQUE05]
MKITTPHFMGVRFVNNAPFSRNSGAGALDTTRDGGELPPFRLVCQVAIIRRLYAFESVGK